MNSINPTDLRDATVKALQRTGHADAANELRYSTDALWAAILEDVTTPGTFDDAYQAGAYRAHHGQATATDPASPLEQGIARAKLNGWQA